jgi:hypothetical protein
MSKPDSRSTNALLVALAALSLLGCNKGNSAGDGDRDAGSACIMWRQTSQCIATGPRETFNDKACATLVESGASGFCECSGRTVGFDCGHASFTCSAVCSGTGDAGVDGVTVSPDVREIDGFTFKVNPGSWWEYKSVDDSSWNTTTGSGSTHSETTFVLELGAPTTIGGDQAFPVTRTVIAGTCSATGVNCVPQTAGTSAAWDTWKFLSFVGKRIRGSNDGQTYSVLFDANTGVWPGSTGFFGVFPDNTGARRATQDPSNANQWDVAVSNSANDCTNIPGYDTVCGPSGFSSIGGREVYDPNIGCVGAGSGANGGSDGVYNNSSSITLVASSVDGSMPPPAPPP